MLTKYTQPKNIMTYWKQQNKSIQRENKNLAELVGIASKPGGYIVTKP